MGIRFRCPNGHKLHVKAFLAGKRGVCPQCGVRVEIPSQSEPDLLDESSGLAAAPAIAAPRPEGTAPVRPAEIQAAVVAVHSAVAVPAAPDRSSAAAASDPIAEAPHAVWYVRPPLGGQYGPASADVMRTWISEGRVTKDSLVWREGWPEWKQAGPLFPGLSLQSAATAEAAAPQIVVSGPSDGSTLELYRRRKSTKSALLVVVLLAFACVVLLGALIYVVKFMN